MSDTTLSRARALIEAAEKATAAPWERAPTGAWRNGIVSPSGDAELGNWMVVEIIRWTGDRDFIVTARNDAPAIAAALVEAAELIREFAIGLETDKAAGLGMTDTLERSMARKQAARAWLAKHGDET